MKNLILLFSAMLIFFGCSGTQVLQPVLKEKIEPLYPYEAKVKGVEGKVEVYLSIDDAGDVQAAKVIKSSGSELLDQSSLDYGKSLKFVPASVGGKAVPVVVKWIINYHLENIKVQRSKLNILVFTKTNGYRHESINAGKEALKKIAEENNFNMYFSEDSTIFTPNNLSDYDVIVFLNTSGDILDKNEESAFQTYMQNHGGFVGIHSAISTEPDWDWYRQLTGTSIKSEPPVQTAVIRVINADHPSTKYLPAKWERTDEWVTFTKPLADGINVLAVVDENSMKGSEVTYPPFCWYHEFGGGRAWYTAGGHTSESYSDPLFLKNILGGIKYAAGIE